MGTTRTDLMLENAILDVIVGVIFAFYVTSLIASAALEAIASALHWRAGTLLKGVKNLLNDKNFSGLALRLYQHALINPQEDNQAAQEGKPGSLARKPSYIDPAHFADAVIQSLDFIKQWPGQSKQAVIQNPLLDDQIKAYLCGVIDKTNNDAQEIRAEIATWFDNAMDRVSGSYKRRSQVWSFFIALLVAGILNINTLEVAKALWQEPLLMKSFPAVTSSVQEEIQNLNSLGVPIGWSGQPSCPCKSDINGACVVFAIYTFLGWLITAIAALFGAPFWFDLLSKVVNLRGTGPTTADRTPAATKT